MIFILFVKMLTIEKKSSIKVNCEPFFNFMFSEKLAGQSVIPSDVMYCTMSKSDCRSRGLEFDPGQWTWKLILRSISSFP